MTILITILAIIMVCMAAAVVFDTMKTVNELEDELDNMKEQLEVLSDVVDKGLDKYV